MIISIGNLPADITEKELKHLFDDTHTIEQITLLNEGNADKVMALLTMDICAETAESIRRRYHRRWWQGRLLKVNVILH